LAVEKPDLSLSGVVVNFAGYPSVFVCMLNLSYYIVSCLMLHIGPCVYVSGVYLCKHADILQPSAFHNGQTGYLIIFKILKVGLCTFLSIWKMFPPWYNLK